MQRLAIVLLPLLLVSAPALALDIPGDPSSCGIVIPRGDPGELQGDLDCTGADIVGAIRLAPGGALHLNGHVITGGERAGVFCEASGSRRCTVQGAGESTGSNLNGIAAASRARVRDLTVHGNGAGISMIYGDLPNANRLELDGVTIRDNASEGIKGGGSLRAKDTIIRDNGGVGTTSYGNSRLVHTTITGNGGSGIVTGIFGNPSPGSYTYTRRQLALVDSDVTGNGVLDGGVCSPAGGRACAARRAARAPIRCYPEPRPGASVAATDRRWSKAARSARRARVV